MYTAAVRQLPSRPRLQAGAVSTEFFQRSSRLSPAIFFELPLYCASRAENSSLPFISPCLQSCYEIGITKQSPDGRSNGITDLLYVKLLADGLGGDVAVDPDDLKTGHYEDCWLSVPGARPGKKRRRTNRKGRWKADIY